MKTTVVLALAAALAAGCSSTSGPTPDASVPTTAIPDARLGLVKESVFDVSTPPGVKANDSNPGELPVLPRAYPIAPPRVPHAVDDFLPITQKQNACLDCHAVKDKQKGEPTPIPSSHYTDYRNAPDRVGGRVVGARYVCVSCHAAKTDAPNLVDNRFHP
ncbi:MAG TPA: nitrate reductase cytochrome c-type subunit [Methylomirabilota bacterium]|nr:nitrate reductase cytochrome c-type subunit [Methylomirabilota bacterium]